MFNSWTRSKPASVRPPRKAETSPAATSHTAGVKQGNARGTVKKDHGLVDGGDGAEGARASARHATGINPEAREPIDPRMPNLPPA